MIDALEDDARDQLEDVGFKVNPVQIFSDKPNGQVVAQDPRGGAEANEGSTVRINVSKGSDQVEVPDVVGLDQADAREQLGNLGLGTNVVEVPSSQPAGTVVAQSPVAGSKARLGSRVRLNVSGVSRRAKPLKAAASRPRRLWLPLERLRAQRGAAADEARRVAARVRLAELARVQGSDPAQEVELVAEVRAHHLRAVRRDRELHARVREGAERVAGPPPRRVEPS